MANKATIITDPDPFTGKLTWDSIPLHDPVILPVMIAVILGGLALLIVITKMGKWQYLWDEWFTLC